MLGFLKGLFRQKASKDIARERLRLVLVHDRASLAPEFMEELKEKLIEVIEEFVEVDEREMEVELTRDREQVALTANIPIRGIRHRSVRGRSRF